MRASTGVDPTNKYAWAENAGWANAAPTNGGVTVHFNGTSGYLTGLAWGENIGWIKLGNDAGGPYANSTATDWGVNLDAASNLTGYAWGENVGWLKFNPSNSVVTIDMTTGRFNGDAWGENIGWVCFKSTTVEYNMRTLAFDKQPQGTPNWWLALYGVGDENTIGIKGIPAWQDYVADTDPTNSASYFHIVAVSKPSPITVYFPSSARRYYTLQWRDDLLSGGWSNVTTQIDILGTGGLDSLQDATSSTQRFYRVAVKVTP
ncbi:MAG: hypothetical protein NTY53_15810 [Kiritimatiellaeota bacterium]|nr:hypothetical protein [Kiritimatiellota bacterium]